MELSKIPLNKDLLLNYQSLSGQRKAKDTSEHKALSGEDLLKAKELLTNPSRNHLKPFILCKLDEDCRYCRYKETCKTNAISFIRGEPMPYEPYWWRREVEKRILQRSSEA